MRRWWRPVRSERGQTLVELLVAIGLSAILLPALLTATIASREGRSQETERLQAAALLREASEAVRVVRQRDWDLVAINGTYHPVIATNSWSLTAGSEVLGNFTRQVVISGVQRNASGAIVASGGTNDPSTRQVTTTVSWNNPIAGSVSNTSYYQRYLGNTTWNETTQADFNTGVFSQTRSNAAGTVTLDTPGNWAAPVLTGAYNAATNNDATSVYVDSTTNRAYIGNSTTLFVIDIANPAAPVLLGSYSVGAAINGVYVSGNFAYLATGSNAAELTVVNVTNPAAPALAGSLNLGDTADATGVFVTGGFAYVTKAASATAGINEFYVVNVATPTAPALSGSLNLPSDANSVYVSGNFAYLATANTAGELTIVNVTTKTAPTQAGLYNAAGTGSTGQDVFVVGTTVYLGETSNASGGEFFIINAANPAAPALVGSYNANADINGVYVVGTQAFLATAVAGREFLALNIATPATPALLGFTNLGNTTNRIFVVGEYAYLASTSNTQELTVVRGGTGTAFYPSGTYESSTFDALAAVAFNYLTFTITEPAGTNIQFQIATNSDNATWNYVGPDGTAGTFFTAPGAIPYAAISGRYFRYKATFTGPNTATPTFSDTSLNYSP